MTMCDDDKMSDDDDINEVFAYYDDNMTMLEVITTWWTGDNETTRDSFIAIDSDHYNSTSYQLHAHGGRQKHSKTKETTNSVIVIK